MTVTVEEALATMRAYPKDPQAWVTLGAALANAGDMHKARQCYERALSLDPEFTRAQNALKALAEATGEALSPLPESSQEATSVPELVDPPAATPLQTAPLVSPEPHPDPTATTNAPQGTPDGQAQNITVAYDDAAQYQRINAYVIPGETLYAVYDCTEAERDFVGITDQRVLFHDRGRGMLRHKDQIVSIPYHRVIALAAAEKEITLLTAIGNFSFAFRTAEKAHWVYSFIMHQVLLQVHPQLPG